ncbi:hypothetical protein [Bacillus testis]|uniref:hypothetical protein n=1 Tax=Bacillus testis TaxID=1622072 RepID=UPI00067EA4A5|nr:hypothetical protein [Bacillus testis]
MVHKHKVEIQQAECPTCPDGTVCENGDLLCVNIPCTSTVVLLGAIRLTLGPVCLRIGSIGGTTNLSDEEKLAQLQQVVDVLRNSLPNFTV